MRLLKACDSHPQTHDKAYPRVICPQTNLWVAELCVAVLQEFSLLAKTIARPDIPAFARMHIFYHKKCSHVPVPPGG